MIPSDLCYVCKRTEEEIKQILDSKIQAHSQQFEQKIQLLEEDIQKLKNELKANLENIHKNTEDVNLDFKVETVRSDLNSFKKIIPNVDLILQMAGEFAHPNHEFIELIISKMTLSEIRDKVKKLQKVLDDDKIFENNKRKNDENPYPTSDSEVVYSPNGYFRYNGLSAETPPEIGNEELEKLFDELAETRSKKESYLENIKNKVDSVSQYKHKMVKRKIPISLYDKNGERKEVVDLDSVQNPDEYLVSVEFPICTICYTLVWHTSKVNHVYAKRDMSAKEATIF